MFGLPLGYVIAAVVIVSAVCVSLYLGMKFAKWDCKRKERKR